MCINFGGHIQEHFRAPYWIPGPGDSISWAGVCDFCQVSKDVWAQQYTVVKSLVEGTRGTLDRVFEEGRVSGVTQHLESGLARIPGRAHLGCGPSLFASLGHAQLVRKEAESLPEALYCLINEYCQDENLDQE